MKKIIILMYMMSSALFAQKVVSNSEKYCVDEDNVALGGYDPVGYFTSNQAVKGDPSISSTYHDVTYYFSTTKNKTSFEKNPEAYLPQFGGWCSMTLAIGKLTAPTYDNYILENGKLYLFERTLSVNGKVVWQQNAKGNEKKAKENFNKYCTTGKIN